MTYTLCISPKSTLRGSKGSWPTSVTSSANEDPKDNIFVGVDTICNWHREGVSMNTLDYSYHTHDHTKSDFSVPSAVPILSHAPPYQEQGESRDQLKQCYKIGKDPATVSESSRSSRRPGGRRGARQGRYWCSICQLNYAQQQGLTRHYRDAHEVSLCTYCSDFKWHRRHQLKKHLEEQHTNVDISAALSEATKSRRKATKIKTSPRRGRAFPAIEHDRCGCVEPPPRRSMPPAVAELSPVSLPNMLFMDNDPQPDSAGPTVKRLKYARIAFPTTKERAPQTDPTVSARSVAIWSVHVFVYTIFIFSDALAILSVIKGSQSARGDALPLHTHPTRTPHFTLRPHLWISCRSNHFCPRALGVGHMLTYTATETGLAPAGDLKACHDNAPVLASRHGSFIGI